MLRACLHLLILLSTLGEIAVRYLLLRCRLRSRLALHDRAEWLHQSCSTVLRRMGASIEYRGTRPGVGLLVSNHLSYLDILTYAAVVPCVFVSKRDVRRWPAFGYFARCGGTIFVDRERRASTDQTAALIAEALRLGVTVLLFPEGTSTDGNQVLRFHSALLQPAIQAGIPVGAAAIGYRMPDAEERDLCYYGDVQFLPHLLQTLGRAGIRAEVEFYPEQAVYAERKAASLDLWEKVNAIRIRMVRAHRPHGSTATAE